MRQFIITMLALTALQLHAALERFVVEGVIYERPSQSSATLVVAGWDEESPIQSLHILGEVEGWQVKSIQEGAFDDVDAIEYLMIDEGITEIGNNAFSRCDNLAAVVLPEGLETIGEEAFASCTALETFVVPSTVRTINARAFMDCTGVTDVYFLMTESQELDQFVWWDGWYEDIFTDYHSPDLHGGIEFNGSRLPDKVIENPASQGEYVTIQHNPTSGTRVHVPDGCYQMYVESRKLEAWLEAEETVQCYPLWWIVNYGVVGRRYTVCDELRAVYVDKKGDLYAKDDNHCLMPDKVYEGEIDGLRYSGLGRASDYDQSNWVVLRCGDGQTLTMGKYNHMIAQGTITGTLRDKRNPVIEIDAVPTMTVAEIFWHPNIFIPASVMGRTQLSEVDQHTYAFVRPKPQEFSSFEWGIYDTDNKFYMPAPDGVRFNSAHLRGGYVADFSLLEQGNPDDLEQCGYYPFQAITRLMVAPEEEVVMTSRRAAPADHDFEPYCDGGLTTSHDVFPIELPDEPIFTTITDVAAQPTATGYYDVLGRYSATPHPGFNIVVKRYQGGVIQSGKIVF
ncbi:MAG: leucine-rich repeat domain-containing protein [Muribaculaceae bacterium]|nr:leucine-rich repeat domain-containing protein [Muribaculaceae bacterium]